MKSKYNISELITNYKNKEDSKSILKIIECMYPAINRYSRQAYWENYEDMQQELILAVMEAVEKIETFEKEGAAVNFLVNAIRNRFYELYRIYKNHLNELYSCPDDIENLCSHDFEQYKDIEFKADLEKMIQYHSPTQQKVAYYILGENITDTEIAKHLQVSRQYVNRCKKRIFSALKTYSLTSSDYPY